MYLKKTKIEDIDNIMEWVNDPIVLGKFANFNKISRKEEMLFLEKLIGSENDKTYSIFNDNKEYVGQVSINKIYWASNNGRLGITIHPKFRSDGYATKAIKEIIRIGFNKNGLHKLWVMLRTDNNKGIDLYESLGFRKEGILKDEYINPKTNEYIDMVRLYLLNNDDIK